MQSESFTDEAHCPHRYRLHHRAVVRVVDHRGYHRDDDYPYSS